MNRRTEEKIREILRLKRLKDEIEDYYHIAQTRNNLIRSLQERIEQLEAEILEIIEEGGD